MKNKTNLLLVVVILFSTTFANKLNAQIHGGIIPIILLKLETGYWNADDNDGDGVKNDVDPCPEVWGNMNGCPYSDKDGDGLSDIEDGCPDISGLAEHNGCPDSDGDGVADNKDDCPKVKGLADHNGCPDSDGDGVADKDDSCPNIKGLKDLEGCPDSDGDGLADKDDSCPNKKGTKENKGCPDSDNDGVADNVDACPNVAGVVKNKGCPEVKAEEKAVFQKALSGVKFQSGKDKLTSSSFSILNNVVEIMNNNPAYNLKIDGYTDSSGDDQKNLVLSQKRAKAVQNYLIEKGIDSKRLSSDGFGEANPIADNKTSAGRAKNRRVELKVNF